MNPFKWLFFKYQKAMWYLGQARSEFYKPMGGFADFMTLLTYLAVIGYVLKPVQILCLVISILLLAVLGGIILTKTGVVAYNQTLANKQNPELLEIKESVQKIQSEVHWLKTERQMDNVFRKKR